MSPESTTTGTRTRVRPHALVPDLHSWVDIAFTLALAAVALLAFGTSFTGATYLVVGMLGAVIAVVVTHLTRAAGWPVVSAVVICLVLFLVLGGPLGLRSLGDTYTLPGPTTLARVVDQAVFGWKDLLTTLPPVDGDGPLLVLPWLSGMVAGLVGLALAQRRPRRPWLAALLPVAGMTVVLAAVILLGVRRPQSLLLQGCVFTALALAWLALRARRASATVHGGTTSYVRGVGAVSMLALAAALAQPVSAIVVGDDSRRAVARNWVEPPFDIGRYPSPLAGFRKYVDLKGRADPANVYDKTLLDIEGVPAGTRVRFAAMDRYDGMVWGATDDALPGPADDSFQRVSSTIDNPVEGEPVAATVTLGEGWTGVWMPTVGALRSVSFETGDARATAEVFRYNLATSTAVVPTGLQSGDRYSFTAVSPDDELTDQTVGSAEVAPLPAGAAFIQGPSEKWTEGAGNDPMDRVLAAAEHLRTDGRYSDGIGRTERIYVAGHSTWRLSDEFVNAPQIVGNDEQYAATMALIANHIGVPARVVLGAVVPAGGRVTGKDVSAWVELRAADGSWRTLPTEAFMSTTPPADQVPETDTPMSGTVIPPPNPIPPPSDAGEQSDADLKERKATRKKKADEEDALIPGLPAWVGRVVTYVGLPLLAIALLLGAVVGVKALRRHRRRSAASPSARFVGAWRELVDHARDLGQPVPLGPTVTRREQSAGIVSAQAAVLARRADGFVFGPSAPEVAAATTYWESVDAERRAMSHEVTRWQRLRAAVSLRSLRRTTSSRDGDVGGAAPGPPPAPGRVTALARRVRGLTDWRSRRTPD
ncbi:transglutaminase-like domain-containing protein [Nocardioides sp. zg-1228]|uniref:transglutaminase-like domain-containing protein n=1 Tax=Nocardioides sp. zg-1228 TaxID=2763008 RepID=UPI0016428C82|nr:transglutaminase-like domain-containing protein [Nocardioides sp. zg-1228]MBC2934850.1 transglutaminase domain-containing protein [Nocardioides sp. zg-1228]QSF58360.1 transglutaminase domain-containing protein [Nocardioides sp. zg-1228]